MRYADVEKVAGSFCKLKWQPLSVTWCGTHRVILDINPLRRRLAADALLDVYGIDDARWNQNYSGR